MRYVPFSFQRHAEAVKRHVNPVYCEDTKGIVAEQDDGRLAGVVLLDMWTLNSVQMHIGIVDPMCLSKLHREVAEYVFLTCNRKIMIGLTPSINEKAIKLNRHFGFEEVYRVKDAVSDGVDIIVFELRRENCRYLPKVKEAA